MTSRGKQSLPLWRVWIDGRYILKRGEDIDAVYRLFSPYKRALITRVDRVKTSSEIREEGEAE